MSNRIAQSEADLAHALDIKKYPDRCLLKELRTLDPAETVTVPVLEADASPPSLHRRSNEFKSKRGLMLFVFSRTY